MDLKSVFAMLTQWGKKSEGDSETNQNVVTGALKNPSELTTDHIAAIANMLKELGEVEPALAAKAMRFIVDGEDEEVLLQLRSSAKAATAMTYDTSLKWDLRQHGVSLRAAVTNGKRRAAPEFWCRLGQFFEAIAHAANFTTEKPEACPQWMACLLVEILSSTSKEYGRQIEQWPALEIEKILLANNLPGDMLFDLVMNTEPQKALYVGYIGFHTIATTKSLLSEVAEYISHYEDKLKSLLQNANSEQIVHALKVLQLNDYDLSNIRSLISKVALGSSKTAREAAVKLMYDDKSFVKEDFKTELESHLSKGSTSERNEAVVLLWKLWGRDACDILNKHLETETSDRVKQTIIKYVSTVDEGAVKINYDLPELNVETGVVPLPESFRKFIMGVFKIGGEGLQKFYEQQLKNWEEPERRKYMSQPTKTRELTEKDIDELTDFVEGKSDKIPNQGYFIIYARYVKNIELPPDLKLIHVVRLSEILGKMQFRADNCVWWHDREMLEQQRNINPFGLRELDAVLASMRGGNKGIAAYSYLKNNTKYTSFCDWEAEAIWPMFADFQECLKDVFAGKVDNIYELENMRTNAFKVLAMFPQVPDCFLPTLWDLALGDTKTERYQAQEALKNVPGKTATVVVSLSDGKQSIRSAAAEWLGKLGDPAAIEPLKKAFVKEKNEIAKGIIMIALDELKANVDEFLNRDALTAEAKTGLAKKLPKGMEWFPLDGMPTLHWADSGQVVDPNIVKWWVVQCVQQKSPVCGPILRRYLSMCRRSDTAALARFVLSSWIAYDSAHPTHEEAQKRAMEQADQNWSNTYIRSYYKDKESLYKIYYNNISQEILNSAIEQKGMLAIVAAAGDADCVKMMEKYIRKYFGNKLAHSKAFVEVLAWIDLPLSLQVLLSFANRFRTKSIRLAAEEHVHAKAERQGWTIDELADRTIPDGGFERPKDEEGKPVGTEAILELDYGSRQFEVRLNDDLEPVVTVKGEGKSLKALPNPGKDDDEDKAKEAKKNFSDAKKIIKEVVKRQTERLYEGLCTQRSWKFDDWSRYLAQHPVVGRLCTRLVWSAYEASENAKDRIFLGCFRPLEDGSLTNENDEAVNLPDDAVIMVAHTCNTPSAVAETWINHFKDYDVTPLFTQFGRSTFELSENKLKDTTVTDFEGHMSTTFKIRSRATKLGYTRGQAEDGGCFYTYYKAFPSLHIQAVIEFTGSYLPEQDMAAALRNLHFVVIQKDDQSSYHQTVLPLGKVPAVLLSECYNDLKQVAADGTGYAADWEKKASW